MIIITAIIGIIVSIIIIATLLVMVSRYKLPFLSWVEMDHYIYNIERKSTGKEIIYTYDDSLREKRLWQKQVFLKRSFGSSAYCRLICLSPKSLAVEGAALAPAIKVPLV